jgi:hypothetical protein
MFFERSEDLGESFETRRVGGSREHGRLAVKHLKLVRPS